MRRLAKWVGRVMRHTRLVESGNPPLYRLILLGLLISSVMQAAYGEGPISINEQTAAWFDWAFIGMQAVGSACCVVGLYMISGSRYHATRLFQSLGTELVGLIFVQTFLIVNIAAVWLYYDRPPTSPTSWMALAFSTWAWFRMRDIVRTMVHLAQKNAGDSHDESERP